MWDLKSNEDIKSATTFDSCIGEEIVEQLYSDEPLKRAQAIKNLDIGLYKFPFNELNAQNKS